MATLDDSQDCNERATRTTGIHFRSLEQRYMKEQKVIGKNIMTQHPPWLLNNITYCYKGEHVLNHLDRTNTSSSIKSNTKMTKEVYTDESKNIDKKTGIAAVFTNITRRGLSQKKSQLIQLK